MTIVSNYRQMKDNEFKWRLFQYIFWNLYSKRKFLFLYLLKCLLLILTLRSKWKKKVSEYSLVSITVEKKKKKKPCITLRLVLDFVFTSFDITPMLLNNLSNFYLHLFNLTFGLDLYLWYEMVISCKKHNTCHFWELY